QSASVAHVVTGRHRPNAQSRPFGQSAFFWHWLPTPPVIAPRSNGGSGGRVPPDGRLGTATRARHRSPEAQSASVSQKETPPDCCGKQTPCTQMSPFAQSLVIWQSATPRSGGNLGTHTLARHCSPVLQSALVAHFSPRPCEDALDPPPL